MHIVLGLLGTLVTILILLNRLADAGIDLRGMNPFLWARRNKWKRQYQGNPIYHIDSPLEATALLMAATVKLDGDMSSSEKKAILEMFENEFHLSKRDAASLHIASTHLLGRGDELQDNLEKVLTPSLKNFTAEQADSAINLLFKLCEIEQLDNQLKREFVQRVEKLLRRNTAAPSKWQ